MGFFSELKGTLLDFLFPRRDSLVSLESLSPEELLAAFQASDLDKPDTVALFDYRDQRVKELVWEIKYKGSRAHAKKIGAILYDVIVSELEDVNPFEKYDVVLVPTPVSDKRRLERGFNQCELLCEAIRAEDAAGRFRYLPRQLVKIRHTESQTRTATKSERLGNLKESMTVQHQPSVAGKFVVLIDDVTTTGATFSEAKRALKEAGAKKVLCVAVAH